MSAARVVTTDPSSTANRTKTDRYLEDAMLAFAGDSQRVGAIEAARLFKRSWIDLAEALTTVYDKNSWERWGHETFESYCRKELHLKKNTVMKLLGSYRFLETNAPRVIQRTREEPTAPIPDIKAVDFVARAVQRGAADAEEMKQIETAAFEEGAEAPMLTRRFKTIAFPVDDGQRKKRLRTQLTNSAKRLATLIAESEIPVPHNVAVAVEEALGQLLEALEKAEPAN